MADPIEEQRLRTIQREYLDFLDDGVGFSLRVDRIDFLFVFLSCRKTKVFIKIN